MHAQGMSNSLQEHRFAMFFSCVPTVRQTLILFTCLCIALWRVVIYDITLVRDDLYIHDMQEAPSKGNVRVLCLEKKEERPLHDEEKIIIFLSESHKNTSRLQFTPWYMLFCINKMKFIFRTIKIFCIGTIFLAHFHPKFSSPLQLLLKLFQFSLIWFIHFLLL